jgi:hypothetical protein
MASYFKERACIVRRIFATELGPEAHMHNIWGIKKIT